MAFINPDDHSGSVGHLTPDSIQNTTIAQNIVISPAGLTEVPLPGGGFVTNAVMTQEGSDLILESPDGITLVIEGYFSGEAPPNLVSDGKVLTPALVKSFIQASTDFAEEKLSMNDATPIGQAHEVSGNAFVTHQDGTRVAIVKGTPIYEGDVVETDAQGAVNIKFVDESSFAVSNNAKMAIDEFVYDSSTHGGENNFSMLRGLFVYTSGLVGREDPDDVKIETPVGSIGIRGTIITGSLPGEGSTEPAKISVVEGAIVIEDRNGQSVTLSQQFETVQIGTDGMKNVGVMPQAEMTQTFNVLRTVAPTLFSAVEEAQQEGTGEPAPAEAAPVVQEATPAEDTPAQETSPAEPQPLPDVIQLNLMPGTLNPVTLDRALASNSQSEPLLQNSPLITVASLGTSASLPTFSAPAPTLVPSVTNETTTVTPPVTTDPGVTTPPPNNAPTAYLTTHSVHQQPGHSNGTHSFDVSQFFFDQDGDDLTYTVTSLTDPNNSIANISVDGEGLVTFTVASTVPIPMSSISFTLTASDGSATTSPVLFNVNIYALTGTYTAGDDVVDVTTGGEAFALMDGNDTATVSSSANIVFGGSGEDSLTILSGTTNNKIGGDDGDDILTILGGTGNAASGGLGNDTLTVSLAATGDVYYLFGGVGNDTINIGNQNALNALSSTASMIDGGTGFDTLVLASGLSIDLTTMHMDALKGIDKIRMASTSPVTVTLDIQNLFSFGGQSRSLYLDVDGNDVINITNTNNYIPLTQQSGTVTDSAGETYNIYSTGQVTLYISTDATAANIVGI